MIVGDGAPDAGGQVNTVRIAPSSGDASVYIAEDLGKMLRWKQQRQATIRGGADQFEHARAHRADINRDLPRREPQVRLAGPARDESAGRMAAVATEQAAERGDGLHDSRQRPFGTQSNPAEKIIRAARN